MTLPLSASAARRAVLHALTTATGQPRALTTLFKAGPATMPQNVADVKGAPRCHVLMRDPVLDGEMENGSSETVHYVCQITCWYYSGSDVLPAKASSENDTALARIETDFVAVRAALCYPGALAADPSGNDTGLAGHALRSDGWRAQGPDPMPTQGTETARVLRVVHFFRASIDQLQPS